MTFSNPQEFIDYISDLASRTGLDYKYGHTSNDGSCEVLIVDSRKKGILFLYRLENGTESYNNAMERLAQVRVSKGENIRGRLVTPNEIQNLEKKSES